MRSESELGPQALPVQRPAGLAEDAGPRAVSAARPRLGVLVLLSLAILLVALGQFYFLRRPAYFWDALTFSVLGILAFVAAGIRSERVRLGGAQGDRASAWSELVPPYTLAPWRLGVLVIAVGFSLLALRLLSIEPTLPSYVRATLYWLASIGAFILAAAPPRRRPRTDLSIWWEVNRRIVFVLAAIVLVALALRVWRLDTIPPVLGGDEGSFGLESVRVLKGELRNPFITGWLSNPTMGMFFNAPSIRLFGNTSFGLRIPWALVGTATILMVFWLVTRLKGLTLGLMTAVLLATYHYHIHFSRLGINNASDPLFAAMALLFLYRAYDRRSPLDWALCGVVSGAAQYFYFGARSIPIIVALLTLSFIVRDGRRFWREQYSGILILAGAFLITAAPMIQFAIRHPAEYNARLAQVGVLGAWLENEQVVRGQGAFTIMLDQFKRAVLAFNAFPDRTTWYGSPQPLFDATAGALFLLGLGYSTLRLDDRRLFPMAVWWWVPMIL
ncbi:MAG TPA: glycosyltransferase family 39 protein, partial [Ardenticatenaceae bacterium]|nr:glycosyltransferase family 39 protein [Ardenticatenaceae bacterium]